MTNVRISFPPAVVCEYCIQNPCRCGAQSFDPNVSIIYLGQYKYFECYLILGKKRAFFLVYYNQEIFLKIPGSINKPEMLKHIAEIIESELAKQNK